MWSQIPLFPANFDFRAQLSHENFKISKSKFQLCNLQLITFPKRYFASKSANKLLRYHENKVEKRAKLEKNHGFLTDFLFDFWEKSSVFQPSFHDILAICWPILMQNSVLETSLVVNYMTEIWI
jgi:hypothetical protein